MSFLIVLIFIIAMPLIGWFIGTSIFDTFTGNTHKPTKDTYITHIHNDNRQVHFHTSEPEESHHLN